MRIINVMRNTAVNSDQRKRAITRSAGKYERVDDRTIGSGKVIFVLYCCLAAQIKQSDRKRTKNEEKIVKRIVTRIKKKNFEESIAINYCEQDTRR